MPYSRLIEEKLDILLRCTNINVKIIACLQASNGLNEDQVSAIEAVKALRKQCQLLYGWMKRSPDLFTCFVNVMEENEQLHVTNFLKGNNDEPHVPLCNSRYERLIKIKPKLIDSIHYSEIFASSLEAKRAISETDCQDVRVDILTNYKRNYILINAIQRRSNHSFVSFEESLRETHQAHAADYLHDGEVVTLHVNTNHPELDDQLSQSLNETIVKECAAEPANKGIFFKELNGINCRLISSKPGKSIVIFLYCKTTDDMATFVKAFNSGRLKSIIERILNRLMSSLSNKPKEALEVGLTLDDEEALLIEEFTGIDDCIPGRFQSRKCVDIGDRVIKDEPAFRNVMQKYGAGMNSPLKIREQMLRRYGYPGNRKLPPKSHGAEESVRREEITGDDVSDHIMVKRMTVSPTPIPSMTSIVSNPWIQYPPASRRLAASYEPSTTSQGTRTSEYNPTWETKFKPRYSGDDVLYFLRKAKTDASKTVETIRDLEATLNTYLDEEKKTIIPEDSASLKRNMGVDLTVHLKSKKRIRSDSKTSSLGLGAESGEKSGLPSTHLRW